MSLSTRKRALLAKTETTYGVDSTPTGLANAMLVGDLTVNPIQAELVSRNITRPYFGNSETLLTQTFVTLDFQVELVGNGVAGRLPAWDPLMKACGFESTVDTDALTSLTSATGVATATLAAHGFVVGDRVFISGATEPEYNGVKTITAVTVNTFDFAVTGTPASPATGIPTVNRSLTYEPKSENFESCTLYFYNDTVLHRATGCFGSFEVSLNVRQIPVLQFSFTGLYNSPTDVTAPAVDFAEFMIPQVANTQNTPSFTLYGYTGNLSEFSMNLTNDVQYITLIGSESVKLLDRRPEGTMVIEAPSIATKDFFTIVRNSETGVFALTHGSKNGYKVAFNAPRILLGNPTYQDLNGVQMLSAPFTLNPVDGNDELSIVLS